VKRAITALIKVDFPTSHGQLVHLQRGFPSHFVDDRREISLRTNRQDERCGMLIPRPQYPLYSAALTMVGGRIVYYDMYEEMLASKSQTTSKNCTHLLETMDSCEKNCC
jgi:hypothetical protein